MSEHVKNEANKSPIVEELVVAESTKANGESLLENGNNSTELSRICTFLSAAQLSALKKLNMKVPADLLKLTLHDLISAAIVTGSQYEAIIKILCRENLAMNIANSKEMMAVQLFKKFVKIQNESNLFEKAQQLDKQLQIMKYSNLPEAVRVDGYWRILGEICYWFDILTRREKFESTQTTTKLKEITNITTTSSELNNNNNNKIFTTIPTTKIVNSTVCTMQLIKTKPVQVVLLNKNLSQYNLQNVSKISISPTLTKTVLPVYTMAKLKEINLAQKEQQQEIEPANEADSKQENVNIEEQISKLKLAKIPPKKRKVVVELIYDNAKTSKVAEEQQNAINKCENSAETNIAAKDTEIADSAEQLTKEISTNQETQQNIEIVPKDVEKDENTSIKTEVTALQDIKSPEKISKPAENTSIKTEVTALQDIKSPGKISKAAENKKKIADSVNNELTEPQFPEEPYKILTRLRARSQTKTITQRTDLRVKLTRKRKIGEVINVENKAEVPASPDLDPEPKTAKLLQISYNLSEIDLPLTQLQTPNSLNTLLKSNIADPRLRKYRSYCEAQQTPTTSQQVNVMPSNIQSPPAFQFPNDNFEAELKQKINMDLYKIQQSSDWYQALSPARKLDITQHLTELGAAVLAFQLEKRLYPQTVFNIFNLDNAIMLIEIMCCLNMNVTNKGVIFQTLPIVPAWNNTTHMGQPMHMNNPMPMHSMTYMTNSMQMSSTMHTNNPMHMIHANNPMHMDSPTPMKNSTYNKRTRPLAIQSEPVSITEPQNPAPAQESDEENWD